MNDPEVEQSETGTEESAESGPTAGPNEETQPDQAVEPSDEAQPDQAAETTEDQLPAFGVEITDAGVLRKRLEITIPRARIDRKLDEDYGELSRTAQVPGFRIGRAPRRLIEKRFGSEVKQDARNHLVGEAYKAAVESHSLKILGEPQLDLEQIKIPDSGDLRFDVEVEIEPEFDLPELKNIPVRRPKIEITDEDVGREIDRIRTMYGTLEPVEEGPAQADDQVVGDVKIEVNGEVLLEASNRVVWVRDQAIEGIPFEGLGAALAGKKPDETIELEADVPQDHEKQEVRGKKAHVRILLREIKRIRLPELDQELLESLGFQTEQELRESIRYRLESDLSQRVRSAMRDQICQYLRENTSLELPEELTIRSSDRALARQMVRLQQLGIPMEEIEKRRDELLTTARKQTVAELKLYFIILKIIEQTGVRATEDEIRGRVASIAGQYGRRPERMYHQMEQDNQLGQIAFSICEDKVMEQLLLDAKIEEVEPGQAAGDEPTDESEPTDPEAT